MATISQLQTSHFGMLTNVPETLEDRLLAMARDRRTRVTRVGDQASLFSEETTTMVQVVCGKESLLVAEDKALMYGLVAE